MVWKFSNAQAHLDDVLDQALTDGPQYIVFGEEMYMLFTEDEYVQRTAENPNPDFLKFLLNGPRFDGIEIERDKSPVRDIDS